MNQTYSVRNKLVYKHRQHHLSFKSALEGFLLATKTEINMKIIISATILVLILGFYLNISYIEWLVVLLTIFLVVLAEMINSSIEAVTDLVTKEWREEAKVAKDISAGAVLAASIGALIMGIVIFLPKLYWFFTK